MIDVEELSVEIRSAIDIAVEEHGDYQFDGQDAGDYIDSFGEFCSTVKTLSIKDACELLESVHEHNPFTVQAMVTYLDDAEESWFDELITSLKKLGLNVY